MRPLTNVTSLLSLKAALENGAPTNLPSKPSLSLYAPRIPLNDLVSTKAREILGKFNTAAFRELHVTSTIGPTTDPELLLDVRLLFSWGTGSMFVEMTPVWGKWDSPRFSMTPFPAGYNSLPARLVFDIVYADLLIKRAGYLGSYEAVDVTWPRGLQMGRDQPYYTFLMEGDAPEFLFVGLNDQVVLTTLPVVDEGLEDDLGTTA